MVETLDVPTHSEVETMMEKAKRIVMWMLAFVFLGGGAGFLIWRAWGLVLGLLAVVIGLGILEKVKRMTTIAHADVWEPKNWLQIVERLHRDQGFGVEDAHVAVALARDTCGAGTTPTKVWSFLDTMLTASRSSDTSDVPESVIAALRVLNVEDGA